MLTPFISIVLIGWIPVCAMLFALFRPIRALTLAYLIGWLALPMFRISMQGFWDIDKILATNVGVALGVVLFCPRQLKGYKVNPADLLLVMFAVGTCITSITNGLGVRDGVSSLTHKLLYYAVPFWFGRAFLKSQRDLLEASRLIVCGAALYALLAVWEWRMSPQIHRLLYGFFQHSWIQHYRWGFYRPIVCFQHALGLGMFMAWTALLGLWLQRAGRFRPVMGVPSVAVVALPFLGLFASMSLGPWALFLVGFGLLACWQRAHRRWLVWVPVVFAVIWMVGRYTGSTDGVWLTSAVAKVSEERAASLEYRVNAEMLLLDRAKERPIFGWGGWGRNRATDETGRDLVATDGLWIILVGSYGLVGLLFFYLWWCWPLLMSGGAIRHLEGEPALMAVLVTVGLQAVNLLFNGFLSPLLTLLCGGAVTSLDRLMREAQANRSWTHSAMRSERHSAQTGRLL